ncbi:transposase [Thiosulfativibrio zosterae]|uniref:Transposase n=1 Tax=Thiosulfativibrio zosterae TaxID=2675053 RepID=A0A6F8PLW6_9GAMM|nr:transposase [Thiosulfativibrio zosterae]
MTLNMSQNVIALSQENLELKEEVRLLKNQLDWFKKQLFGQKTEKRLVEIPDEQLSLLDLLSPPVKASTPEGEVITVSYQRRLGKLRADDTLNEAGLRFNDQVPVEVIEILPAELQGPDADDYEIIGLKQTFRLAQRPSSYVILRYDRPIIKHRTTQVIAPSPAPDNVLDKSLSDVSFIVGLLIDKFQYHIPFYRQHQRLNHGGITLSRSTLTNLSQRSIDLLRPIVMAQLDHVLRSKVLAMDETPIKAGLSSPGKLKQAWFWPIYGQDDEVVFTFSTSRGRFHIEKQLKERFCGTLISDGYSAYARFAQQAEGVTHAQCWVHTRRQFINAQTHATEAVNTALDLIGKLYHFEEQIKQQHLQGELKRNYRLLHSKPIVEQFFEWALQQSERTDLTPKDPFRKAIHYALTKQTALQVFLSDPEVPLDTNHLEIALRPIPMGRKNWLFCWTEMGAEQVGIIQSLITTCKLHDINPYTYLTDVLLRINQHPAKDIIQLTPRVWKATFAHNPLKSELFTKTNSALSKQAQY